VLVAVFDVRAAMSRNLLLARATVREKGNCRRSALDLLADRSPAAFDREFGAGAEAHVWRDALLAGLAMKQWTRGSSEEWAQIGAEAVIGLNVPVLLFAAGITH